MEHQRYFSRFRLDPTNEQLWQGEREIRLRRMTFQVLRYLLARAGELVTKEALLDDVWGKIAVSDSAPSICVAELRKVLGDDARAPSLIETVHGRGYRFIAQVRPASASSDSPAKLFPQPLVVGRDEELAQIRQWFANASQGRRQVVFVTGEPGIGKTTLIWEFLKEMSKDGPAPIAHGQCVEQYGVGEPYMPVLEALTRLARRPDGEKLSEILRKFAPSWLAQMPSLLTESDRQGMPALTGGFTQQRVMRQMAEALEAVTAELPLVLVLEDLHWSDFSTLQLLSLIGRRSEAARLLIIGTYRPEEIPAYQHPLRTVKQELELHHCCQELSLKPLSESDVAKYLALRFAQAEQKDLERVAHLVHKRTEGNPLFMVNVVDYLNHQGSLLDGAEIRTPDTILRMIERNFERLSANEQSVLEAASIVGADFSAAAVAAALERPVGDIEVCCANLSRREKFVEVGRAMEWPDGTVASRARFLHALYHDLLYERVPPGRRVELHRKIAEREEAAYGERAAEIATELAHHFHRGNDRIKAVKYLQLAGRQAVKRSANQEAISHFATALRVLETWPPSPERQRRELKLFVDLQAPLIAANGYTSSEVERVARKARELCRELGDGPELFAVLGGLSSIHLNRLELKTAIELGQRMQRIAEHENRPTLLLWAHYALGFARSRGGELHLAREHLEQCLARYERKRGGSYGFVQDPGPTCLMELAGVLDRQGYPDLALQKMRLAINLARELSHPFTLAWILNVATYLHMKRGDELEASALCDENAVLCAKYGFDGFLEVATVWQGLIMARRGVVDGIAHIHEGLAIGKATHRPDLLGLLAEAHLRLGQGKQGLAAVTEALSFRNYIDSHGAWLNRLKGELLLIQDTRNERLAEYSFRESLAIARKRNDKSNELKTMTALARLVARKSKAQARTMLAETYNWFTEGLDTFYLKEAKVLLDELGGSIARPRRIDCP